MLTIRALMPNETPDLRSLLEGLAAYHNSVADSFAGIYPLMPVDTHLKHMREHIENGTARILGIFGESNEMEGFAMASVEGDYGEVDYLYVKPQLRGQGWGVALMDNLMEYLEESKVRYIDVRVVRGNPAKGFYEKYGFRPRSDIMTYCPGGPA